MGCLLVGIEVLTASLLAKLLGGLWEELVDETWAVILHDSETVRQKGQTTRLRMFRKKELGGAGCFFTSIIQSMSSTREVRSLMNTWKSLALVCS